MAYFKINNNDYSNYVYQLAIVSEVNYNSQINAAGDTVVDYINTKRNINVGIIAVDAEIMPQLLDDIQRFNVNLSFRNPQTNQLEENVKCIIPTTNIEYYTIQDNKVLYKELSLSFMEL